MKIFLFITLLLLGTILPMKVSAALNRPPVSVRMQKTPGNGDRDDDQKEDKRIPSAPVYCTIDFANQTVSGDFTSRLLVFEVWSEDGEQCIATFDDESHLIEYLDSAEGDYQLRFYSDSYVYIGFISL